MNGSQRFSTTSADEIEAVLVDIWEEVLEVEGIDGEDEFAELGGDSLDAVQVATRVRRHLGLEIPLEWLLRDQPLSDLVQDVAGMRGIASSGGNGEVSRSREPAEPSAPGASPGIGRAALEVRPLPRHQPLPASSPQRRLWYLDRLHHRGLSESGEGESGGDASYNMCVTLRFDEALDLDALQHSLDELVLRHEALRTRFTTVDGAPWQVIDPRRDVPLEVVDLGDLPLDERYETARRQAENNLRRPFDLSRDVMLRGVALLSIDEGGGDLVALIMHHVASDGWSIGVLLRDLAGLYAAFRSQLRAPSPLPPLALHFADFAHWQEEAVEARRGELLGFWRDQLAGAPATVELPFDRPRPLSPTHRGALLLLRLDGRQAAGLAELARVHEATRFMILLAAFDLLLYRVSGQSDLPLSVPVANRLHPEAESVVGFFTNMLVMRVRLEPGEPFGDYLRRVRRVCLDAYAHQEMPFDRLVEVLQPDRQQGQIPFVQLGFVLQNSLRPETFPGFDIEPLVMHSGVAQFELSLELSEFGEVLEGSIEYRTELFDASTIQRWCGNLRQLITSLLADPSATIDALPILPPSERHQLLTEWASNARAYDLDHPVHHWVRVRAARSPGAESLRFVGPGIDQDGAMSLTYAELVHAADRLASRLDDLGVTPGAPVGVLLERSLELGVAFLAVLEAGGACVPLDPDLPDERLRFLLEDTGAAAVLTHADLRSRLPGSFAGRALEVGPGELAGEAGVSKSPDPGPRLRVRPGDLAYVIYTSGSTGRPKGVRMHHRGLCNRLFWEQDDHPLDPGDRVLQNLSVGFDAAFWQFFGPWIAGAAVVLPRPGGHMDTRYLAELMAREEITCADFVPSILTQLLAEPALERCTSLRQVVSGGEALTPVLAERLFERFPNIRLINIYGPTETSLTISAELRRPGDPRPVVPIGRPVSNLKAFVVDRLGEPVPIGTAGEMVATGVGITQGYLGRPALTAERFVPHPGRRPGERRYRTGDLVRHLADGTLDFLGRIDHQVKVRGVRIELGEIEEHLQRLEGVRETAVLARDDVPGAPPGDKRLVAYVASGEPAPTPASLREGLAAELPPTMVPGLYVFLDSLPLLVNGKVDRKALPVPEERDDGTVFGHGMAFPRDRLELELSQIWCRILGLDEISITRNFFELGGHSLLAVRLMSETQRAFDVDLDLAGLYAAGTVQDMAERLRGRVRRHLPGTLVSLAAGGEDGPRGPLICVHAVDGTAHAYGPLARALGNRGVPVYGLQAPDLEDDEPPTGDDPGRLEDLASRHVDSLIALLPEGPYHLCGWSQGGLLASEMTRQLRARGRAVASLVLLDTHPVAQAPALERSRAHFATLVLGPGHGKELPPRTSGPESFLAELLETAIATGRLPGGTPLATLERHWRAFERGVRRGLAFEPRTHDVSLTLLRADAGSEDGLARQTIFCESLTRATVEVHTVAGDHHGLLRAPAVTRVAERLFEVLDGCRT